MGLTMKERKPIYRETAKGYQKATKKAKCLILDSFVETTGLNRDYAATLLRMHGKTYAANPKKMIMADIAKKGKRTGRKKKYDSFVLEALKFIWKIMGFICGKRLRPILNDIVINLSEHGRLQCTEEVIEKLRIISASSIDRLLKHERQKLQIKGRNGTKPGTLLKQQIAVRTWAQWNENQAGYMEIDLVGHEGGNSHGDFAQTLDMVDVNTGWSEQVAIKNKAALWVKEAVEKVRQRLPFDLLGLDSDTGAEFINHAMEVYCKDKDIKFTRGRSSRSNDNCYVEQKNYSIVRQTVGYSRYDTDDEVKILNRIYGILRFFTNHFQPVMKLTQRVRVGSKVTKQHKDIQTPYERVMKSNVPKKEQKALLLKIHNALDVFMLRKEITKLQKKLWNIQRKKQGLSEMTN